MTRRLLAFTIALKALLFVSCKTYIIPIDSFKKQFEGIDSTKLKPVEIRNRGLMGSSKYLANPITTILCEDKNGNAVQLNNSPSIELRLTYGPNNKRSVFYFDRVYLTDSLFYGVQSRLVTSFRKRIKLNEIKKIEVQDGKKSYYYVE